MNENDQRRFVFVFAEKKIEFTQPLKDVEFGEWTPCALECELNKRNVDCRWYKDTTEIYPNDHYRFEVDGKVQRLLINRLELDDTAIYGCLFRKEKTSGKLTVKELPYEFTRPLEESVTVVEKQQLVLDCETNKPLKDNLAIWTRDGQVLTHNPTEGILIKSSDKTHTLTIYECKMKDHGQYVCTVKEASTSCQVNMKGKVKSDRAICHRTGRMFCRSAGGIRSSIGECHRDRRPTVAIELYVE